jgi:hypothetical protein
MRARTHRYMTAAERLLANRSVQPNGCWHYTARIDEDGYGRCGYEGKTGVKVHRVAYMVFIGPIPEGMTVNHKCHDDDPDCPGGYCPHRRCFNPDHLVAVTVPENLDNGKTPSSINAAKEKCDNGHEFTPLNTYIRPDGTRRCKTCQAEAAVRYEAHRPRPRVRKKAA